MTEQLTEYKTSTNGKSPNSNDTVKPKVKRRTCGIPARQSLSEMSLVIYQARVEQQLTEWEKIKNYEFYSPASDGSHLMQKITRSKSLDLQTRETLPTTYGQAYRVHLGANPTSDKPDF
ncbi:hypothetical protein IQ247_29010 [Plectonema cf. radiosum LEGE 06105]|uniref:Uncharacterized protein n=1 Tax=Plectonema cf. radiosum LEGE 06105 TaxID=945769 RepID=A0A8J7FI18_9CYAN|nr:hypothetical protein [Plectonema radiosum]MBE9216653.1 hypothetical protein [Plectonema cf. radiosum LEGE 06105]